VRSSRPSSRTSLTRKTVPGLHIQAPWAQLVVSGRKTVETRFYPLPKKYIGTEMAIIETPGGAGNFKARIIGIVKFGESFRYESAEDFYRDSGRHLVQENSDSFHWASGKGKPKWGWPIESVYRWDSKLPKKLRRGIVFTRAIPLQIA
jgi:hypothetical protein